MALSSGQAFDGSYSYSHTGYGDSELWGAPFIDCPEIKSTGWFTGHVYFETMPNTASTENAFWATEYESEIYGEGHKSGLSLYLDVYTAPDSVVLKCPGMEALCKGTHRYTVVSGVTTGQWYTYTVYWDLPSSVADGRIDVWWDGVHVVDEDAVETLAGPIWWWYGTNRIYSGMIAWHSFFSAGKVFYTDALEDCVCKIVGNVTPVPPP